MKRDKEWFKITSVHRDDLIQAGFDGDDVDDATMERLASKMCDDYVEQLFWGTHRYYCRIPWHTKAS